MAKRTLKLFSAVLLGLVLGTTAVAGAAAAADVAPAEYCMDPASPHNCN